MQFVKSDLFFIFMNQITIFTLAGKYGVYLNFFSEVQRRKVPKKRNNERKNISGEYLHEYDSSPPNLK